MPEPSNLARSVAGTEQSASVGSGVEETVPHPGARTDQPMPAFAPPIEGGEVGSLGPYRIVKELGRGGMGAVYAAIDTRLDRKLALKVMLPQFAANPDAKERFLREARAAAKITHDNVVTVYEADERDGVPYIAMQFLKGYPLDEYLKKKGNPSIPQVLRIAREAAAGLAAAHKIGLVHRDIKPANIWLEAPNGRVKILDFGLARPVDAEVELTKSGAIVGTPAFMAPEQARGEKIDHRVDLFSLGGVLYRLCTGKLPFEGPNTMAVLMALGTTDPTPVRTLNSTVPEALATLIHQLLAKDARARPQTAADVVKRVRLIADELASPSASAEQLQASAPIQVTVLSQANPFAEIDATEPEREPAAKTAAPEPVRKKPGMRMWVAAGFATLLVACVVAGVIIIIKNQDGTETKIEVPDGSTVTIGKGGEKVVVQPPAGNPAVAEPDRKAAEWVLSVGGVVTVNNDGLEIRSKAGLPKGRFTLTWAYLSESAITDAQLAVLKDCKGVLNLTLTNTKVTDAGLVYFRNCKGLTSLSLRGTQVTDAGLVNFKDCKALTYIDVRDTKVTAKRLEEFHAAVPGCKIEYDGGTIENASDPDRKAAEYVLSIGGAVQVNSDKRDVKAVAELPKERFTLTGVNLAGNKSVTDAGLANFRGCKGLTVLNLEGTPVTDLGLAYFKDCERLTFLKLMSTKLTDAGLTHFKNCKGLTLLSLTGTKATDEGVANFKDCKNLTILGLAGTRVTDVGLANFKDCKGMTWLNVNATGVTETGLAMFKDCKDMAILDLQALPVTDAGLAQFKDCKNLTSLDVRKTKVTAKGLTEFHTAVPGCKIEHDGGTIEAATIDPDRKVAEWVLSIGGAVQVNSEKRWIKADELPKDRFTLRGIGLDHIQAVTDTDLARCKECKGLVELHLSNTSTTDVGVAYFKDCKTLTYLELGSTAVTDAGLANFKDHTNLTDLGLGSTQVTDTGLAHFKDCTGLGHLALGDTQVTDAGVAHFKNCKRLMGLYLSKTAVTDAGLRNFQGCKSLRILALDNTPVTDAGLMHFKDCTKLTGLYLQNTAVTDEGLAMLKDYKALTNLNVQKTKVTAKGLEEFHTAVPRCLIKHDGGTIEPEK